MKRLDEVRRTTFFEKCLGLRTESVTRQENEAPEEMRLLMYQGTIETWAIEFRHAQIA